ncbi:MAG: hypothetical protein ACJAZ2_001845 [Glaciecola sp.]|jgi:uncharacterized protein (TIGR02145 family)
MKVLRILTILVLSIYSNLVFGQNDTMYVMKNGLVVAQFNVNTEIDSVIFYKPTISSVTDIDGNTYGTVSVGNQEWMLGHLKTTKYSDGTVIPNVTSTSQWGSLSTGAWSSYDNNSSNDSNFGKLYNWYVASDARNVCPTGWRVPTNGDWTLLTDFLYFNEHVENDAIALKTTSGWDNNKNGTDDYGFSAYPAGSRSAGNGLFYSQGATVNYWASDDNGTYGWTLHMNQLFDTIRNYAAVKETGFAIRCLKDQIIQAQLPTVTTSAIRAMIGGSAVSGGNVTGNGGAPVTQRGLVWSTSSNPTISDSMKISDKGIGSFIANITGLGASTKYYVRAFVTNSAGTAYGNEVTFTTAPGTGIQAGSGVSDVDGNSYTSAVIGTQEWMSENLKTLKYNDGTTIPEVTDDTQWRALTTGALTKYDHSLPNVTTYGNLYNWHSVNTKKLCPTGWHIPSDSEWDALVSYLANQGFTGIEGTALKSTTGWDSNGNGDHDFGWKGLPGGFRSNYGNFWSIATSAYWWSSTQYDSDDSWVRVLSGTNAAVSKQRSNNANGFSARCLKD